MASAGSYPFNIVCTITQRNNLRRANTCDPALKLLNEKITSEIQKHKQNLWKEHLDAHWDHRHNTHNTHIRWNSIYLLSVIAKRLEKNLLHYITANIPNKPMQHGYKTQHSTVTELHTLNNTVAKGFDQMVPPMRTITVALDMSKAFDTINTHTNQKAATDQIPDTIIKFIANYIKGRKAYTTYRNHTSDVPQDGVFHQQYITFTLQTYHHPEYRIMPWSTRMTSHSHLQTQSRMQPRNTYNHTYVKFFCLDKTKQSHTKSRQNNLHLFIPDPGEYKINLDLKINNTALLMATHPKVRGITLYPNSHTTHTIIAIISAQAHNLLQMTKPLTATGWANQKETLMVTYKAAM